MPREFHLSPPGTGRGISCDAEGAFIGAIPVLKRLQESGKVKWQPRDCDELSDEIGEHYGLPIDMSSKTGGLKAIANALNAGNLARAQIATVLLAIPDPLPLSKSARSRDAMIKLIRDLHWSGLIKEDWNADDHPRWPAGSADSTGGQFAPKGEGGRPGASPTSRSGAGDRTDTRRFESDTPHRSARTQLADADNVMSDASDSPLAEAACAAAAQRDAGTAHSQVNSGDGEHQNIWQAFEAGLSHEVKSALAQMGSAEIAEGNANLAAGTAEANAIAHMLKAFDEYGQKPWYDVNGHRVQIPVINTGSEASDQGAIIAHILLSPDESLTRPGTNTDWIGPLLSLVAARLAALGRVFGFVRPAAKVPDNANVSTQLGNATEYRATFGKAPTNDYRSTFFEINPELESQVVVHHAVPQRTLLLYPDEVTESEIHSLDNLRGIPNKLNSDIHLSQIAREWNQFYKMNPNATQEQLLQKATEIDLKFGSQFKPQVGRNKSR